MPICIVLISAYAKMNSENKRAQIIIKAIEANKDVDTDKLIESLKKPRKTPREILNRRLLLGCIFTLVGLLLCGIGFMFNIAGVGYPDEELLIIGGICLPVGIGYLVTYFATRKQVEKEEEILRKQK